MKYAAIEDDKIQEFIEIQLEKIVQVIKNTIPETVSIVLSGSFSRGEGSIQFLNENDFVIQKDFDVFIFSKVIPNQNTFELLKKSVLEEIKTSNNEKYKNSDFKVNLEFINMNHLDSLPPDISTYELKKNGVIIFGKNLLKLIPESVSKFNTSTILRLLLNKLIGLIENNPFTSKNPFAVSYECHKTYIEINTALCILINCYETTYFSRYEALKKNWNKLPKYFSEIEPNLLEQIARSLKFKLEPMRDLLNVDVEPFWFETKDLLADLLVVVASHFISNPIRIDSEENLITYLKNFYYFPYSQRFLSRFGIKSQFLNHLVSKAYVILQNSRESSILNSNLIIKLYLSSFYLLKAIKNEMEIDKKYFNVANKYIQEKENLINNLKNWIFLANRIINLKTKYDLKKIKKRSSILF